MAKTRKQIEIEESPFSEDETAEDRKIRLLREQHDSDKREAENKHFAERDRIAQISKDADFEYRSNQPADHHAHLGLSREQAIKEWKEMMEARGIEIEPAFLEEEPVAENEEEANA